MSDDIKKGLLGIVVDETEVSKVMPEINSLTYRGYAAQDLCEYCRFEEVAYLILNKDLPNTIQLRKFEKEERNNRELTKNLYEIIKHMPKKSHPMDVARTAVSVMGLEDKETTDSSPEANMRKAFLIFASGEESVVSLSSKPITLTAVLATSIGWDFFGMCLIISYKFFVSSLLFLSSFSNFLSWIVFGRSLLRIRYATSSNLQYSHKS